MPQYDWRSLMQQWNAELLADEDVREELEEELGPKAGRQVIASGWLGYPGASEAELVALERRLGVTLPPSYREFLAYTNGWRTLSQFIPNMWNTAQVEWLSVRNQGLIDTWTKGEPLWTTDEKYLDYDPATGMANELVERTEYYPTLLEISDREISGTAIIVLNPRVVTPEGEWEAWFHAHWVPGAERYRTFWDLMVAQHNNL